MKKIIKIAVLIVSLLIITPTLTLAASNKHQDSKNYIVLANKLSVLSSHLSLIAKAMGVPIKSEDIIYAKKAYRRNLYFLSDSLLKKSDRLTYEITEKHSYFLNEKNNDYSSKTLLSQIDVVLENIKFIEKKLKIEANPNIASIKYQSTATDLFNQMLKIDDEMSVLLYKKFSPSDVYQQVTLAVNITGQLLKHFNIVENVPAPDKFVPNKRPTDVYKRLLKCLKVLKEIGRESNVEIVTFDVNLAKLKEARPENVFDLSTIIVAEISYLNSFLPNSAKNIRSYYSGHKIPSDVYQRASILLKQLNILNSQVVQRKDWLEDLKNVKGHSKP